MTGRGPAPVLRLVPGTGDDDAVDELQASMVRHPAGSRRKPPSRRRWWLRIGRRA